MPVTVSPSLFVPKDGRFTSQNVLTGTLDPSALLCIVSPGNEETGNTYAVSLATLAPFFSGVAALNTVVVTDNATDADPYPVQSTDVRVLMNVPTLVPHAVLMPLANAMVYNFAVLVKDLVGNADTYPITINFTGGETCDGLASFQITSPYGWFYMVPKVGGGGWYMA